MTVSARTQAIECSDTRVRLIGTALLALLAGACVYLVDRDWASTMFLGPFAAWQPARHEFFGAIGETLPSLLHAYAFTVLLAVTLWPWPKARSSAVLGWFAIAAGLEILQAPGVALAVFGPPASSGSPLVHSLALYAWCGEFDPADLLATALGCASAWVATSALRRRLS